MYNAYFGFKEAPFSIAPDPRYLYMTGQHREALAHLVYGLNSEGGCILLTGEVGTGKTTVCRCLLEQIPDKAHIALVLNPKVSATELLETICDELNIAYPQQDNTVKTYIDLINGFLLEANARNEKTVLIIDEAQNLDSSVLEQLRLLTNLETNQRKLLQIIILGQPELLEILARKEMRQLAQRITARFHLNALSRNEVKAYISHRLAVAGQNVQLFPEATISQLYRLSKGIPRLINILCDRALLGTYVQSKPAVDRLTLNTAAKEVFGELKNIENRKRWTGWQRSAAVVAPIALLGALLAVVLETDIASKFTTPLLADNQVEAQTAQQPPAMPAPVVEKTPEPVVMTTISDNAADANTDAAPAIETTNDREETQPALQAFFLSLENDNSEQAYRDLFGLWQRDYPGSAVAGACSYAQQQGLSCLHTSGNLHSLRKLNRPAILRLYDETGRIAYALVTRLEQDRITINSGGDSFEVDRAELEQHWYGEYSLLWQKPPFYSEAIQPGSSGPVVQWLDQQLTRLYGQGPVPTIHDTYSEELVNNVKKFQQSRGLIPDGVAGPLTFIHLNTEIGMQTPQLTRREGQEA